MPLICYAIVLVGSLAIAIVIYTVAMLGFCTHHTWLSPLTSTMARPVRESWFGRFGQLSLNLNTFVVSTVKYKKGIEGTDTDQTECVVCLSSFEDEELVQQLPRCEHFFHAPCINMWLYSHSDCPLCRAPVDQLNSRNGDLTAGIARY